MVAIIFERELREVAQSINVCLEGRNVAKISVIVPVYNVEPYLRRCINSIINQTFDDFDLVLVDDGSPDRCGEICDEYAEKDTRISVIHQQNSGLSAARNVGIDWSFSESDSDWLTFVDSDDWIHLEYLEILFREAVAHRTNVCICDFQETTGKIGTTDVCMEGIDITPEEFYDTTDDKVLGEYYFDLYRLTETKLGKRISNEELTEVKNFCEKFNLEFDEYQILLDAFERKYELTNSSHIRIDYDDNVKSHHKTEIQYSSINNIRLPLNKIISPFLFMDFIVRYEFPEFYNSHKVSTQYRTSYSIAQKHSGNIKKFEENNIFISHV